MIFLVDSSGSITQPDYSNYANWNRSKLIVEMIVSQGLTVGGQGDRVAAVDFSNDGYLIFNLTQYQTSSDVVNALANLNYVGGTTNTPAGIQVCHFYNL